MISFNKLVQSKRTKMLLLTIFLVVLVMIQKSSGINLTYILKKERDNLLHPSCIAEEVERYSAIGWVFPLPNHENGLPNITSKLIPEIDNSFNCKFLKNAKCNHVWAIKNWEIDKTSTRTLDLILDRRWEDFPEIFTREGNEFKEWIEIPSLFRVGISVRTSNNIGLFICEGWNPNNYPCYHVEMSKNKIVLHKYATLPKNSTRDKSLDNYQAYSNILSGDEWRNFIVSLDAEGVFTLIDVSVNRTVLEYQDQQPLKPLYLLFKSSQPALWKVHQNQFMYTTTTQLSRLGPTLNLASKYMCVSLYVSTCPNCGITFILIKGTERKILKEVAPTKEFDWQLVKLKEENVPEKLNVFIETKFVNATNQSEGFWAIDDVRVCHENEVKVTFLKLKNAKEGEEGVEGVSCQVVAHPNWRPRKLAYSEIKDSPTVENSSNATAISLSWAQEDPNSQISYFISYEANDLCESEPFNLNRLKSNGFLTTKHNEITIDNLIPYTKYNITISSVLHEKEKKLYVTTLESESPTAEEGPNRLQIQVFDTVAYVSWDKVDCSALYGHILYGISVTNLVKNSTQQLKVQTENVVQINDLEPFNLHTLSIVTARSFENIENNNNAVTMKINFTTKAGVAPAVRNLELYSVDKDSVSIRYDLPMQPKGIPAYVRVTRCNPLAFKKCKSAVSLITPCQLWPFKYCLEINNLISSQKHNFKISIKNDGTEAFGAETQLEGYTSEQVPGPPGNITYKIVDCKELLDYCHMNVTWLHPYNQNGTITAFNIVLNSTTANAVEDIKEVFKIPNKTYSPTYNYQIQYIPYSTQYELYVQSVNGKYKSSFASTHVKTADIGDHIDQSPKLLTKSETTVVFKVPPVDSRLKSYILTVIVQDFDRSKTVPETMKNSPKISDNLCHNFGNTWVSQTLEIKNDTSNITVGSGKNSDAKLQAKTQYCITFVVTNKYRNSEHDVVYYEKLETPGVERTVKEAGGQYNHFYGLLLLLLLVPVGFLTYKYLKKKKPKSRPQPSNENVYESLPFEECCDENNCVANETYDQLLHK